MSTLVRMLILVLALGCFTSAFAIPTTPDSDFIDNGDATVTHKTTGLIWKRCSEGQAWDGKTCTGEPAFYTYAQTPKLASNFAGNSDWRMPNVVELATLLERGKISPTINTTLFPNTPGEAFWSLSPIVQAAGDYVWGVMFGEGGYIFWGTKSDGYHVRLVRGGQPLGAMGEYTPTSAFTDQGNGTVTHKTTGLIWQRCTVGQRWDGNTCSGAAERYSYDEALKLTSNLGGQTGWRLPTSIELLSLVEYKNAYPAINRDLFPNTIGSSLASRADTAFWTSSLVADNALKAQMVYFDFGYIDHENKSDRFMVRLVRTATTTGTGYIEGNILNACNKKPLASVDVNFSGNSARTQQTDRDGHYSIKLGSGRYNIGVSFEGYKADSRSLDLEANETRLGNFVLTPTAGCEGVHPANTKQAIIVAGSGPKLPDADNHIWASTQALADRAYVALRLQGFRREDIRYLSADPELAPRDADHDGSNDISGAANLDNLHQALTQWAGGVEQMVVYMIGHGGVGNFQLNRETLLTPAQLKPALNTLQAKLITDQNRQPGKLSLIIDACKSGGFIAPLAAPNRYIVTSTGADLDAVVANKEGSNSFSYHFWGQVGFKDGWLSTAFQQARQAMSSELVDKGRTQKAMLDADGSGGETTEEDYKAVGSYCYGDCKSHASVASVIESVSPLENLDGNLSSKFKVRASKPLAKAWITLQRPDYHFPSNGTALTSKLQINLTCNGSTSCEGEYNNFNLNDAYLVTFNVEDLDQNIAAPYTLKLLQKNIPQSNEKKNADAVYEASTGVLTLKDVLVAGHHFYVELQHPPGEYRFNLKPTQLIQELTEAASAQPAQFDGQIVKIPKVWVAGSYYAVELLAGENGFTLGAIKPE